MTVTTQKFEGPWYIWSPTGSPKLEGTHHMGPIGWFQI